MKRVSIALMAILLFFIPNMALAEQALTLHTLWDIPWDTSADAFENLALENAHVTFERTDSGADTRFTSETGDIPFFGLQAKSALASFTNNALSNVVLSFPELTADVTDLVQMQNTIEDSVQDLYDKWSVLTKEYGSLTYADICLSPGEAAAPCYKVPMIDGALDLITIRNIVWEAFYASVGFNLKMVWNNVELEFAIHSDEQTSAVSFSMNVCYDAFVNPHVSVNLDDYPLQ